MQGSPMDSLTAKRLHCSRLTIGKYIALCCLLFVPYVLQRVLWYGGAGRKSSLPNICAAYLGPGVHPVVDKHSGSMILPLEASPVPT